MHYYYVTMDVTRSFGNKQSMRRRPGHEVNLAAENHNVDFNHKVNFNPHPFLLPRSACKKCAELLYHFSVLVKPRLGFLAKLAKRTRRLIIFHKSWRLSPNAMRGIPKGAGQCSVFPVAINTDGSAATQGRQQCKIFLCLFGERKPQWSKSCEKQIRGRGQSLSRWWEKQIKCEASSRGNHDTRGCNLPSRAWVGEPL